MRPLSEIFAVFKSKVDDRPIKEATRSTTGFTTALQAAGAALAAYFGARAVHGFADQATEIERTAQKLGLSTDAVQEFGHVAQMAGRRLEDFEDAFSTLQERARDALDDPKSDPAHQLEMLGVAATDAAGQLRSGEELFLSVADSLQRMENQTDRVGAVMTLFGDEGRRLLPVLQQGSSGIEEMREQFRELGGGLSRDAIVKGRQTNDALIRMGAVIQSVKGDLAAAFLPAITRMIDLISGGVAKFRDATKGVNLFRIGVMVATPIVTAFAVSMIAAHGPLLLWAAGAAALILVVDDLVTLFEGGDSVLGRFLATLDNGTVGFDGVAVAVMNLRQIFDDLLATIEATGDALGRLFSNEAVEDGFLTDALSTGFRRAEAREAGREAGVRARVQARAEGKLIGLANVGPTARERFAAGLQGTTAEQQRRPAEIGRRAIIDGAVQVARNIAADAVSHARTGRGVQGAADITRPNVTNNISIQTAATDPAAVAAIAGREVDRRARAALAAGGGR